MSGFKNLKYIPTKKLQEILNDNHTCGTNGKDYGPVKHELEQILWERQSKEEINTDDYFPLDENDKAC